MGVLYGWLFIINCNCLLIESFWLSLEWMKRLLLLLCIVLLCLGEIKLIFSGFRVWGVGDVVELVSFVLEVVILLSFVLFFVFVVTGFVELKFGVGVCVL